MLDESLQRFAVAAYTSLDSQRLVWDPGWALYGVGRECASDRVQYRRGQVKMAAVYRVPGFVAGSDARDCQSQRRESSPVLRSWKLRRWVARLA
jgi:hypothetical protein